jgi:hypothetical protein
MGLDCASDRSSLRVATVNARATLAEPGTAGEVGSARGPPEMVLIEEPARDMRAACTRRAAPSRKSVQQIQRVGAVIDKIDLTVPDRQQAKQRPRTGRTAGVVQQFMSELRAVRCDLRDEAVV